MKCSEVIRRIEDAGWRWKRQSGSHAVYVHPQRPGQILIVPAHGSKEMPTGTARRILKQAGVIE
jgi:predicted RNA binding protein YcfA (HicA-like mRNA interferase family)